MKNTLLIDSAYINGKFIKSKHTFDVVNPATGKVIASLPDLKVVDCTKAIIDADKAWKSWKNTTVLERCNIVRKWYDLIQHYKDDLAEIMTLESGKPLSESRVEVDYGSSFVEWFSEEGKRAYGETIPTHKKGSRMITIRQGVGVVAAITPWNFPLAMITRKVAPALVAGCTVVLKPASQTPFSAIALAKLAEDAGIPKGVFNVITGKDSVGIGKELATNDLIRKLSFTGSTEVGKTLIEQSASNIKKVSMELGGNAPFLVFNDADIDAAVEGALAGKFRNSGQTCVSINRFLIQEDVYDEFSLKLSHAVSKLKVGNGLDKGVQVGPLINAKGLEKVQHHVQDALNHGAELATGGKVIKDLFFQPTVLTNVPKEALIFREETFGPICALFSFKTEEEGIAMANTTEFGLASYFYSTNINRCFRVAEQLEAGMVGINTGLISNAAAPFGGVKQSGVGREGSKYGLDEYMELKYICFGGE
ncbi:MULTISPECIES: NAD-dependent succinate-semialdehyde dehydrogenase [Sphingobacterium]|jgi:succinate-semialdehyde dehydrogenase/glutarate-semialdehyde dehydrogenase|uniref:Succinate-semialdehyde dehydrogenase/glutarate-semialdehyde dehydrogenase n=1 Tax=Sphingobacterium siyangense TaxID=459529 RepID=A0A562MK03_9SPHI|nr:MULTISPECIES: NAD-dependent succinate-semialdehyde dehydrogenase [Sphingobacterium]TWI20249.1 succinate-semialdehyde dehydrogenase/glutarate-semialdehyde dehydrogenase [Sphingobacterium siyangense]